MGGSAKAPRASGNDGEDCALTVSMLAIRCNRAVGSTTGTLEEFTNMEAFGCIGLKVGGTESAGGGSQLTDPAPLPSRNEGDKKNITSMHLIMPKGRGVELA